MLQQYPQIQRRFEQLADLMIKFEEFRKKTEEVEREESGDNGASEALLFQFKRIYALESGRELMEKAQKEALFRLSKISKEF